MPSGPLTFRPVCGCFHVIFLAFMLKRERFTIAMRIAILKLKTRRDGVMAGVLLILLFYGDLLHRCGDVELNPGPDPTTTPGTKQTRLTTSRAAAAVRSSSTSRLESASTSDVPAAVSTGSSSGPSTDPCTKEILAMLTSLNAKFDKMSTEFGEIKQLFANVQDSVSELKEEMHEVKRQNDELKCENARLNERMEVLDKRVDDLEGRSKRNNVIIHGIPRPDNETWQECEETVRDMITDKLEVGQEIRFDRVHRLNSKATSPIVARLTFFKDKERVLKAKQKLRGTDIFIGEDYSLRIREIRRHLVPHMKSARSQNKKVSMVYDHLIIDGIRFGLNCDGKLVQQR